MNNYLIFRTDRIGDFFISLILIKSIIKNDQKAEITLVASKKNYQYIKNSKYLKNVYLLKDNIINKLTLFSKLNKKKYKSIIIHDNKQRSKIISFFLKSEKKININHIKDINHIDIIKFILKSLNFNFTDDALDTLGHKKDNLKEVGTAQLHFDEKWIFNDYIKKYVNIEPCERELTAFIKSIMNKYKRLRITTGVKTPKVLKTVANLFNKDQLQIHENLNFFELENITMKSNLLISCHGAISHIAAALKIKQIDIIDESYNYSRWTKHFRNYEYVFRQDFKLMSEKILEKI